MIRHIVFLKIPNCDDELKQKIKQEILSLRESISVLKNMEVGLNFSPEERAYDIALIADFESKDDLNIYATNPTHLKLIQKLKELNTLSKVVDYELFK